MSKRSDPSWPIDHPEITAIALDIMITPARRAHYSALVLALADAALDRMRRQLASGAAPDTEPPRESQAPS